MDMRKSSFLILDRVHICDGLAKNMSLHDVVEKTGKFQMDNTCHDVRAVRHRLTRQQIISNVFPLRIGREGDK